MTWLHVFRRDLRIHDNLALELVNLHERVIGVFILDAYQICPSNVHFSPHALQFMFDALRDLRAQIRENSGELYILRAGEIGKQYTAAQAAKNYARVLADFAQRADVADVSFVQDYSPYAVLRDRACTRALHAAGIHAHMSRDDNMLHALHAVRAADERPYTVFGYYYKAASEIPVRDAADAVLRWTRLKNNVAVNTQDLRALQYCIDDVLRARGWPHSNFTATRAAALQHLRVPENYARARERIDETTTQLSVYLQFGLLGIRECYHALNSPALRRQLYWRTHYFLLAAARTLTLHADVNKYYSLTQFSRFRDIAWNTEYYDAMWCGKTGFLLVDACVRCLNSTGWLHNRGRMILANFSIKILHLDMTSGQRAFSARLIDGSYASNFGNWAWMLGSYDPGGFRYGKRNTNSGRLYRDVLHPKRVDPKLVFIRRWLPEYAQLSDNEICTHHVQHGIVDFHAQEKKWYALTAK